MLYFQTTCEKLPAQEKGRRGFRVSVIFACVRLFMDGHYFRIKIACHVDPLFAIILQRHRSDLLFIGLLFHALMQLFMRVLIYGKDYERLGYNFDFM